MTPMQELEAAAGVLEGDDFLIRGALRCTCFGFRCIGIEEAARYVPLIKARLAKPVQTGLGFDDEAIA